MLTRTPRGEGDMGTYARDTRITAAAAALRGMLGEDAAGTADSLAAEMDVVTLAPGETLFREGDAGDALYVLIAGSLDITMRAADGSDLPVDALAPGAVVGEMALLTGQRRSATVTARAPAELTRLRRDDFVRLGAMRPAIVEGLIGAIRHRLRRTELTVVLTDWFGPLDVATRHELEARLEWITLAGGEVLYREGDTGDSMYLVVSGRLRAVASSALPREAGRGECVGELAPLSGEPREATVVALRDSDLVRLPRELIEGNASLMAKLARLLARRSMVRAERAPLRACTFAFVPISKGLDLDLVVRRFHEAFGGADEALRLDAATFDREFGREGAAALPREHALAVTLTSWLSQREAEHRFVLYQGDPGGTPWTQRCIRQADRVVLVADAKGDPAPGALERAVRQHKEASEIDLVLVHDDDTPMPSGTLAWLEPRDTTTHHHVRLGSLADLARVARLLSGRAHGLVCSGGGARGYVHIGLLRAMEERGITVDAIVGTSMGALVAGGIGLGRDWSFCRDRATAFGDPKRLIDVTFPVVALAKSHRVTSMLRAIFGDVRIEDLWVPYACVSTNLTRGERTVHDRGPLWEAVRASLAIPGVFTPVLSGGDVLVDGGITSNYPVDLMRERLGSGIVIGSNAFPLREVAKPYDFGHAVSGWRFLGRWLNPLGRRPLAPSILDTLMGATLINSRYRVEAMAAHADLNVGYPVEAIDPLAFDQVDEIIGIGHRAGGEALDGWLAAREERATDTVR
jgi:lysophospholipid hydrolase